MLKTNEIYNMDCMEGIELLDDKSIDLVVMDPPYLLNLNKIKNTSSINNYANELIGLKDGFDLKVLDLLIPKMKKINMLEFVRSAKKDKSSFRKKPGTYLTFIREIISSSLPMPNRAWRSLRRILSRNTSKKYSTKPRKGRIVVCLYFWEFP